MATYQSDRVNASGGKDLDHIPARARLGLNAQTATFSPSVALAAADLVEFVSVPSGAVIIETILSTNGDIGSTLTADLGDGGDVDRFIDGANLANSTGSIDRIGNVVGSAATGPGYTYTEDDNIDLTIVTAAGGTTDATITLSVIYLVGGA